MAGPTATRSRASPVAGDIVACTAQRARARVNVSDHGWPGLGAGTGGRSFFQGWRELAATFAAAKRRRRPAAARGVSNAWARGARDFVYFTVVFTEGIM
jgi:hypothetical protein